MEQVRSFDGVFAQIIEGSFGDVMVEADGQHKDERCNPELHSDPRHDPLEGNVVETPRNDNKDTQIRHFDKDRS